MSKRTLIILGILMASASVISMGFNVKQFSEAISTIESAIFDWEETTHNFSQIKSGTSVEHKFIFKNTGNAPLIISAVKASCGCTVADYSKDPVMPGAEGFVKAVYTASTPGIFTKTVTVTANTDDEQIVLSIKGEVIE
ncbi:MAG TPA: DUF1573 domain-containing protein [Cyclobacteriaceae bacterium]|nr:DUF1573 domain-containing protein [Cyclobacteriaceae bacterium]